MSEADEVSSFLSFPSLSCAAVFDFLGRLGGKKEKSPVTELQFGKAVYNQV